MKTPLTQAQKASRSINFGSQQGERPHSLTRELSDLRNDIEEAFVSLEGNSSTPVIQSLFLTRTNFTNAGNGGADQIQNLKLYGKNFFAGRAQASIKIYATGSLDNYITLTAILPGTSYNAWTVVAQANSAGADQALDIEVDDANKIITIQLDTDNAGAIEDAAENALSAIRAALATESDVTDNFVVSAVQGDATDRITSAIASTSLSGGEGQGVRVLVHQPGQDDLELVVDCTVVVATNDVIALKATQSLRAVPNAGDLIGFSVVSHTAESNIAHASELSKLTL